MKNPTKAKAIETITLLSVLSINISNTSDPIQIIPIITMKGLYSSGFLIIIPKRNQPIIPPTTFTVPKKPESVVLKL